MKQKLVKINLHGELGEIVGSSWNLAVKSVAEAIHAIEIMSKKKLNRFLAEKEKGMAKYQIVINDEPLAEDLSNVESINKLNESALKINNDSLRSIDIVPVIEGAGSEGILGIVLGVILVIVGIVLVATGVGGVLGGYLIVAGVGLIAAGVVSLLTKPPSFADLQDSSLGKQRQSYLNSGPINTISEGGPVPVGYGRLIVGSQVVATAYNITLLDGLIIDNANIDY